MFDLLNGKRVMFYSSIIVVVHNGGESLQVDTPCWRVIRTGVIHTDGLIVTRGTPCPWVFLSVGNHTGGSTPAALLGFCASITPSTYSCSNYNKACLFLLQRAARAVLCLLHACRSRSSFPFLCVTWCLFRQNKEVLDAAIREERDFEYDYFGFKTLEKSYLLRRECDQPLSEPLL